MRNLRNMLLICLGALALPACAQQTITPQVWPSSQNQLAGPAAAPPAPAPPGAQNDGQMHLNVHVTNKAGQLITGLDRGDFTLLEDKHPVQITGFKAWGGSNPPPPAHILLVIDTVNLSFDRVSLTRIAIGKFLRQNEGHLANPVSIYWLTDDGVHIQGPESTDGNAIAAQLDATAGHLRLLDRDDGIWGAIERYEMTVQMLQSILDRLAGESGRKLVIWLGPGWPMIDNPNVQLTWDGETRLFREIVDVTAKMRKEQVQLYSVSQGISNIYANMYQGFLNGVKKPQDVYLPNLSIKVLAVESGGMALTPSNDLTQGLNTCVADAGAYYTVSFQAPPAGKPDEYHELTIRIDKPGVKARTTAGYYDPSTGKGS